MLPLKLLNITTKKNDKVFLPTSIKEIKALGWEWIDVILFTGDAYIDHSSFGTALIGRALEAAGYRVAIVPQPNWQDDLRDFKKLGAPRLFFGVNAGAMDSTVMHYTPTRRIRSDDAFTPENRHGARPDYPTVVYTKILKELYPDSMVVIGGIEASLRRFTHYDYLQDILLPSFAYHTKADALIYGMGELAVVALARAVEEGENWKLLPQIAYFQSNLEIDKIKSLDKNAIVLHSMEECLKNAKKFADNFVEIEKQSNKIKAVTLIEPIADGGVVVNAPYPTFSTIECDQTYALPFMRSPAPRYRGKTIAAWDMIKHSVNIHRGCYGGCSFCAISMHQGKYIASRSKESIVNELEIISQSPDFKGTITDIGGPSANMWKSAGVDITKCEKCSRPSCLAPKICPNLNTSHTKLIELYKRAEQVNGIKHLFIGSGIRYDMIDYTDSYFERVVTKHTSGRFKVAPEHTEDSVLKLMRKPKWDKYQEMQREFDRVCSKHQKPYVIVPYFISAHPGCSEKDMARLKDKTAGVRTNQVQDFTPTPMTLSSVMFYCGFDPYSGEKLVVARSKIDKDRQKSYFFEKSNFSGKKEPGRKSYQQSYQQSTKKKCR